MVRTFITTYFASVYTKANKAKSVIKDIKALGLKAVYPVEYTNDNGKNINITFAIDLSEKLAFLFEEPYGFYNCACYNGALALCLRKYINKIRLIELKRSCLLKKGRLFLYFFYIYL